MTENERLAASLLKLRADTIATDVPIEQECRDFGYGVLALVDDIVEALRQASEPEIPEALADLLCSDELTEAIEASERRGPVAWRELERIADEVIAACDLPIGCRGTLVGALAEVRATPRPEGDKHDPRERRMVQVVKEEARCRHCNNPIGRPFPDRDVWRHLAEGGTVFFDLCAGGNIRTTAAPPSKPPATSCPEFVYRPDYDLCSDCGRPLAEHGSPSEPPATLTSEEREAVERVSGFASKWTSSEVDGFISAPRPGNTWLAIEDLRILLAIAQRGQSPSGEGG